MADSPQFYVNKGRLSPRVEAGDQVDFVGDRVYLALPDEQGRYLEVRAVPGGAEVRLGDPGSHALAVFPCVSNVVQVLSVPVPRRGEEG